MRTDAFKRLISWRMSRLEAARNHGITDLGLNRSYIMLRLTKKADYSLIALKHLASRNNDPGRPAVSAKEVADSYGIPLPLLSKILQKLTQQPSRFRARH